jgi:hypothetical protein
MVEGTEGGAGRDGRTQGVLLMAGTMAKAPSVAGVVVRRAAVDGGKRGTHAKVKVRSVMGAVSLVSGAS